MKISGRLIIVLVAILLILPLHGVTAAQNKVTVKWWHIFTTPPETVAYVQKVVDDYMKAHPNVTIEATALENDAFKTRLATVMQSGEPPDIFQNWGGGVLASYADAGLLRDITPELTANNKEWLNTFSAQATMDLYKAGGKYYGLALSFGGVGFWYNKDLFAKAGIKEPPKTWPEFLDAVKKLKDAGITPISLGEKDKWPGHYWWVYLAVRAGGKKAFDAAYTRAGSFADKPFVQAGELLKQLVDAKPFPEGFLALTYPQQAGLMGDGKAAMELMGQWAPGVQRGSAADGKGIPAEKMGWFVFPTVPDGVGDLSDMMGGGDGIAVGKNAPDAAIDFLKYLTSPDVQKGFVALNVGWIPTLKAAESAVTDPLQKMVMEGRNNAKYYQLYYDQFLPPALANAVVDNAQNIFTGSSTPEEAAKAIEAVAATELKK